MNTAELSSPGEQLEERDAAGFAVGVVQVITRTYFSVLNFEGVIFQNEASGKQLTAVVIKYDLSIIEHSLDISKA